MSLDPSETHPTEPSPTPVLADARHGRRVAAMAAFGLIALAIAVSDQILKAWVVDHYSINEPSPVVGDWFRINFIHNNGGLFGLFQGQAQIFALVTLGVVAVLVAIEVGSGWRSWLLTITLALLLGGAIGNFIDRLRYGYVVDFADIGIGSNRFYIFNIADSAVTIAIILMLGLWFLGPYLGIHMPGDKEDRAVDDRDAAGSPEGR
jgi:signal peptidase II